MYEEAIEYAKQNDGYPKRLSAPLGLSEWECSDGKVFYDSKSALYHEQFLRRQP